MNSLARRFSALRQLPLLQRHPRRCRLELESLEERTLLSTSLSLSTGSWTALGPAPIVNGQVPGDLPVSGRATSVAPVPGDPNTIYLGTAGGGVWKTSNANAADPSWTPLTDFQPVLFIGAVAVSQSNTQVVYAGTGEANGTTPNFNESQAAVSGFYGEGILKSTDAGNTWTLLGSQFFFRHSISKIVVDPTDSNIVYAAVGVPGLNGLPGGQGIWRSLDGGNTWTNTTLAAGIPDTAAFSDLVIDPTNRLKLFAAAGDPNGNAANTVYVTTTGGNAWARSGNFPMGVGLGRIALAISPNGQVLDAVVAVPEGFMNTGTLDVIEDTINGGMTWNAINTPPAPDVFNGQGNYDLLIAIDPNDNTNNTIYVGGAGDGNGSFISATNNAGANWTVPDGPFRGNANIPGPHADYHGAAFDSMNRMLVVTDGGIWRLDASDSANGFQDPTWTNLNGNLNTITFFGASLSPTDPNRVLGGSQDNGNELFADNGGGAAAALGWTLVLSGDGGNVRYDPTNTNIVYAEANTDNPNNRVGIDFLRSDTGGQAGSFNPKNPPINPGEVVNFPNPPFVLDPINPQRILLGTNFVWETLDRGENWGRLATAPNGNVTIDSLTATSDPNVIYVSSGGRIFVTFDRGGSWTERDPVAPQPNLRFFSIVNDPRQPLVAYVVAANFGDVTGGGHVWMTTNGGVSWKNISGNLPDVPVWSIALDPRGFRGNLYIGTDQGVYQSVNQGVTWTRFGAALPNVQVRDLQLNLALGILLAGTHGRGAWEILITPPATSLFDVGAGAGNLPEVKAFNAGTRVPRFDFFAYPTSFTGGVRVAVGDVNGDGIPDLVLGPGPGAPPEVKVISGLNSAVLYDFFAFATSFTGGVWVGAGDVNGDGYADIIVGAGSGASEVKVFGGGPSNAQLLRDFFAFGPTFLGGARVASADVNNDGFADLIVGAGPGDLPEVKVFSGLGNGILYDFFALDVSFRGGITVAGGDVNGDGFADLVIGAGFGGAPEVKVFSGSNGQVLTDFFAFQANFDGGVRVATVDYNSTGRANLLVGTGPIGAPEVRIFDALSLRVLDQFFAFDPLLTGGISVGGA